MVTTFDDWWYADMIERFRSDTDKPSIDGLGASILAGFCILAQSIDGLSKVIDEKNSPRKSGVVGDDEVI